MKRKSKMTKEKRRTKEAEVQENPSLLGLL
jgi:hypothetical protein